MTILLANCKGCQSLIEIAIPPPRQDGHRVFDDFKERELGKLYAQRNLAVKKVVVEQVDLASMPLGKCGCSTSR